MAAVKKTMEQMKVATARAKATVTEARSTSEDASWSLGW